MIMDNNGKILDMVVANIGRTHTRFDEYGADDTANTPVLPFLGEVKAQAPSTARLETTNVFGTFNALCANLDQAIVGASTLPRLASLREVDETLQRVVMACEAAIVKAERLRKANR